MNVPFVDLRAQFATIQPEIDAAIADVLQRATFVSGPQVERFERNFARYVGSAYCAGVESGTAALKLAFAALGIGPGDEVILPANTYIATAIAVSAVGAQPVLVDMDAGYGLDVSAVSAALTPRTRAIVPVHLYGRTVDMQPLLELAQRHALAIVEDACQAHGAMWGSRRAGSIGTVGCFSFYPGKNLGAYGDGGAVVTDDPSIDERIRLLRDFGQAKKYEHVIKGDNCRLDSIQAAVLDVKLRYLDRWNEARRAHAARYDERLRERGFTPPPAETTPGGHVYHLYVIEVRDRSSVQQRLSERGIQTGIHYPIPIHLQRAYADLGLPKGSFPRTEASAERLLSLPMFAELQPEHIDFVVAELAQSAEPVYA